MILSIETQLGYFFSTILAGFIVGMMFDVYRVIRGSNPPNKIIAAISDILFWILSALVSFVFLIVTNNGDLRYYTFVGIIIGILFYFKIISRTFRFIVIRISIIISTFFVIFKNLILIPFKFISYIFSFICVNIKEIKGEKYKDKLDMDINHKVSNNESKKEKNVPKENKEKRKLFKNLSYIRKKKKKKKSTNKDTA